MKTKIKIMRKKYLSDILTSSIASRIGLTFFVLAGIALFVMPVPVFSSTGSDVTSDVEIKLKEKEDEIILQKTNEFYNKGLYYKAVEEINIGIELHQEKNNIPDNIKLMGEASYYAWINALYKDSGVIPKKTYDNIIQLLTLHPEVMSPRVKTLVDEVYDKEKLVLENDRVVSLEKNDRKGLDKILQKIYRLDQDKKNLDEVINGNKSVKEIRKAIRIEAEYKKAQNIKSLLIALYTLIFVSIVVLILFIRNNHRKTLLAQENFETTMKVVAILQANPDSEESPYSKLNDADGNAKSGSGKSRLGRRGGLSDLESEKAALEFFETEDSKKKFLELQNQCIELGDRIDHATGRKRNARKVSELVFKLCKVSGVDDELSLIYYCASMVYDAGFLAIPRNILHEQHLTIKQRYEVRSHVQKAGEYYSFIPESIRRIFLDAAEFHHENIDGKGYLVGLSGNKIPLIARFIRVAESYVSLINYRNYREIMDAESAISELNKKSGIYDSKILALLEKVV